MRARKVDMQRLMEQRDRLLADIEALRNKVAGIEMAMALIDNEPIEAASPTRQIRLGTKSFILDLLMEMGTTGLNAVTALEIGERRGVHLERQSVSSMLSRLKTDGLLVYEDHRYKLVKFASEDRGVPLLRAVTG
jgi:hypothetical protein